MTAGEGAASYSDNHTALVPPPQRLTHIASLARNNVYDVSYETTTEAPLPDCDPGVERVNPCKPTYDADFLLLFKKHFDMLQSDIISNPRTTTQAALDRI